MSTGSLFSFAAGLRTRSSAALQAAADAVPATSTSLDATRSDTAGDAVPLELARMTERLEFASAALGLGFIEFRGDAAALVADPTALRLHGFEASARPVDLLSLLMYVEPDEREPVLAIERRDQRVRTPLVCEYGVHRPGMAPRRLRLVFGHTTDDGRALAAVSEIATGNDAAPETLPERRRTTRGLRLDVDDGARMQAACAGLADDVTGPAFVVTLESQPRLLFVSEAFRQRTQPGPVLGPSHEARGARDAATDGFANLLAEGEWARLLASGFADAPVAGRARSMWLRLRNGRRRFLQFTVLDGLRERRGLAWGRSGTRPIALGLDLTEWYRGEESLRESEERLRAATEAADIRTWWIDEPLLRRGPDAALRHTLIADRAGTALCRIHPDDEALVHEAWERAREGRGEYRAEFRVLDGDGRARWLRSRGRRYLHEGGRRHALAGATLDITARKSAEEALRAENRRKDEYLAMLAHELRNPLAPIQTSARILERQLDADARLQQCATVIARQAHHMGRILDDLLDVGRLTRGRITLRRRSVDLREIVRECALAREAAAHAAGLELYLRLPDEPVCVHGDETRLMQILGNLLSNACRFTPTGGRVSLRLLTDGRVARLEVSDTGRGIEPELLSQLFEPFVRGAAAQEASHESGLGIGLALVRRLVELHGGSVVATSGGAGRGTTVAVVLPIAAAEPADATPSSSVVAPGTPTPRPPSLAVQDPLQIVLLSSPHDDGARSLAQWLRLAGHYCQLRLPPAADDEAEVLASPPDAVIFDLERCGERSLELARRLRAADGSGATLALIALSGRGQIEDRRRTLQAGFDLHLLKPCDPDRLQQDLTRSVQRRRTLGIECDAWREFVRLPSQD